MISGSVYARDKINEVVEANAKPQVDINRNDEDNTIEINVKHIRGITKIAYKCNDEQENFICDILNYIQYNLAKKINVKVAVLKYGIYINNQNFVI